ncbi:ABC transporter permease [Streptomyces yaizuensis]|uniref:ABC transporter permease n=1 Tax=Streptomyces yaizuensis TaxID=2989713 RepID=A0ABQ5NXF1_9ACTN|nr:ABC transporter permease [Streptomyces sp. YSPA8]GLF94899.1 ABC transporter permease [Streptomyces sp. YSPA8]
MSATTTTPASSPSTDTPGIGRRGPLRGVTWVVWRCNRTALLILLGAAAAFALYCAVERPGLLDALARLEAGQIGRLPQADNSVLDNGFLFVQFLPLAVGVFIGAPLLAREEEQGTLRLITTQSVGRTRVAISMLALPLLTVAVCTTAITTAFTWLWRPAHAVHSGGDWWVSGAFMVTGPMPVALTLFLTTFGIAAGAVLRRAVAAMGVTFLVYGVWDLLLVGHIQRMVATPRSLTYPLGGEQPQLPEGAAWFDRWAVSADGELHGWGSCVLSTEQASVACMREKGLVSEVVEYLDYEQLGGMQWTLAAILLTVSAVLAGFAVWWTRRKSL